MNQTNDTTPKTTKDRDTREVGEQVAEVIESGIEWLTTKLNTSERVNRSEQPRKQHGDPLADDAL